MKISMMPPIVSRSYTFMGEKDKRIEKMRIKRTLTRKLEINKM